MGLLDDAIREHLDLQRRRGADPAEIERAEREALGPVRRGPEAHEPAEGELEEQGLPYDDQPAVAYHDEQEAVYEDEGEDELEWDDSFADEPHAGELDPDGPEHHAPPAAEPLEECPAPDGRVAPAEPDEHPTQHMRLEPPAEPDEDPTQHMRLEPDEPEEEFEEHAGAGTTPAPHAAPAPPAPDDAPRPPRPAADRPGGETVEYDALGEEGTRKPDEDVLEETPEFLQETPDHDRLWFEQRPPRDFDFEG